MDTKLKSNNYIINILVITIILIASIGMCLSYPKIQKDSEKFRNNIFEEEGNFLTDINKINYSLYYQMYEQDGDKKLSPTDVILERNFQKENDEENNDYKYELENLDSEIYNFEKDLNSNFENLECYAVNKKSNEVKQVTKGKIDDLASKEISSKTMSELKEKYSFYIVLDYDDKGNVNIEKIYGANKESVLNSIQNIQRQDPLNRGYLQDGFDIKPITNMKFVYAVPKNMPTSDRITSYMHMEENYAYSSASKIYINIAMIFIILAGVLIPYKEIKELVGFRKIVKIPLEIAALLVILSINFIYQGTELLIIKSIKGELLNFAQLQLSKDIINILTYSINVIYWFVVFGVVFAGIMILKYIYKSGLKTYIKQKCLVYKTFEYILNKIQKILKWCINIQLNKKDNKKIITILVINFIIITLMCSIWFFGIIVAMIYSVVLFVMIKKQYNKVTNDYTNLLKVTNEISSGNLDVNTDDDLGTFNVLKDEIGNIQKGFKKAVNEEVKSQKMKTELISNVSHDLKTPLTSIITYVDLLKDKNLSDEKREKYLDTLDRKSQRLQELIEDLFEVSKANSGNVNLNIVDVDIVSLMKQTLLEVDDKIKTSSLNIRNNFPSDKVILKLDSQRMFRVFENLLVNITKYAMEGSRVYIDIFDKDDYVEISLKNMTADEINFNVNELVERFVRGDKSRNTEGSGLGLAIAKSFVELQGGEFDVSIDGDLFKVVIKFAK
ncbi:sensor histidine kinase [Romboutsia sedimentorum]|uniref:sensor histidine kinase n=1 Tax=Romboutsia sedimentorum TaxID=1368474 RepID=UPI0024DE2F83|nr:sensor histidine kinase [Romboutsia sedimentorum]MDK2584739.1 sensor histidine kinase [Romboutsia sedimentorum]